MADCPKAQTSRLGRKKLLDLFARTFPEQHKPADSTGDLILARAGLVKPRKRRRKVSADSQSFNECTHANSTWCVDFKGQFALGNRKLCYPLTVTDHFSRYLFMCQALSGTQSAPVTALFEQLFTEFGLPWACATQTSFTHLPKDIVLLTFANSAADFVVVS